MSATPTTPTEGQPAPDFRLPATGGVTIARDDFAGKQSIVLYFYPQDDTPGCTKEACGFRDLTGQFAEAGAAILGVSPDDVDSHEQFTRKFGLPFPLLADFHPKGAVAEAYGVFNAERGNARRVTFIIDEQGIVRDMDASAAGQVPSVDLVCDMLAKVG